MRPDRTAGFAVLAAFCTCLLGLGLARFAYTPLIPALIAAHWFAPGRAAFLGAANIAGYLAGAIIARPAAHRLGARLTLRLCMLAATVQFFACMQPASFTWFLAWRFLSGLAGAGLMVLAAPIVLPLVPSKHRGLAGGVIFTGIGWGMIASGTVLPVLLHQGVSRAWLALGLAGAAATATAWLNLPSGDKPTARTPALRINLSSGIRALFAAYAISAAGQVPVILFLADFAARGLHEGVAGGARLWAIFGAGAIIGPLLAGAAADRIGHMAALRILWFSQIAANALFLLAALTGAAPSWVIGTWPIAIAAAITGAGIPGLVVLVLGRSQILAGPTQDAHTHAWSRATIAFALGQAIGAYSLSAVFAQTGGYDWLFAAAVLCMALAAATGEFARDGVARAVACVSSPEPL